MTAKLKGIEHSVLTYVYWSYVGYDRGPSVDDIYHHFDARDDVDRVLIDRAIKRLLSRGYIGADGWGYRPGLGVADLIPSVSIDYELAQNLTRLN